MLGCRGLDLGGNSSLLALCRLADPDLDLAAAGLRPLAQLDAEHACVIAGDDIAGIDRGGQGKGAVEAAIGTLDAVVGRLALVTGLLCDESAFAADRQGIVLNRDMERILGDPRDLKGEH